MRRSNNKNNDNHILTPNERLFYQRMAIDGTQRIIDECLTRYKKDGNLDALKLALDGNVQLADMFRMIKEQYYPASTATDHDNSYDYGR